MTDREKTIVMAHTGICMLTENKFQIFHKYVEDIMGRPIMTHEIGYLADTIKEKSKADFMALCVDESSSENPNKWIPVSERLPEDEQEVLITYKINVKHHVGSAIWDKLHGRFYDKEYRSYISLNYVTAWMPLPEPFKAESEG